MNELDDISPEEVRQILSGDYSVPLSRYPPYMCHPKPQSAWDHWENERHAEYVQHQNKYWQRIVCRVLRAQKLEKMRQKNAFYCNKCTRKRSRS